MASFVYNIAKQKLGDGTIDWDDGNVKTALVQAGGTAEADRDNLAACLAGSGSGAHDEVTVSGYARQTLTSPAVTVDDVNDKAVYDADDTTYTSLASGETPGAEIAYYDVDGTDANAIPIHFTDFASDSPTDGNNFVVQYSSNGIFDLS